MPMRVMTFFATLKIDQEQNRYQLFLNGHSMETKEMKLKNRCKGRTKAGKPCRAAATEGGLCFFHANPNKASELGRIGGRSNRHAAAGGGDPLPTLDNAVAIRDTVARLIADVIASKVHPRVASGLAPLMNLQLRAIETANLELRVEKLEKLLAQLAAGRDEKGDMQPTNPWASESQTLDG
jgi:hypothetical protein